MRPSNVLVVSVPMLKVSVEFAALVLPFSTIGVPTLPLLLDKPVRVALFALRLSLPVALAPNVTELVVPIAPAAPSSKIAAPFKLTLPVKEFPLPFKASVPLFTVMPPVMLIGVFKSTRPVPVLIKPFEPEMVNVDPSADFTV